MKTTLVNSRRGCHFPLRVKHVVNKRYDLIKYQLGLRLREAQAADSAKLTKDAMYTPAGRRR